MPQIRIQVFCAGCQSNVDLITHPTRAGEVLNTVIATLRATHLPSCYEEVPDGQNEGGSGDAAKGPGGPTASGPDAKERSTAH